MKKLLISILSITILIVTQLTSAEIIPVWNKVNGEGMHEDRIHDIEFLRGEDQFILLTGIGDKGAIQIRDTQTGELISTFPLHTLSYDNQIEITPDSNRCIITTGGSRTIGPTIELRNLSDYSLISKDTLILDGDKDPLGNPFIYLFRDIIVDPIRPLVYVLIEKTNFVLDEYIDKFYLRVYNYETMSLVKDITPVDFNGKDLDEAHITEEDNHCFDVSDDGRYLAALNDGKTHLRVWDLETYELIRDKPLNDFIFPDPNEYLREVVDIEFSSIDNDLIYFSGYFPKNDNPFYPGGIFKYNLSSNESKKIELDNAYSEGKFLLFDDENKILVYAGFSLIVINQNNQKIELNTMPTLEYPLAQKTIRTTDGLYIGFSLPYIGSLRYDSQSNVLKKFGNEIIISPNPTSSIVNIDLNCSEPVVDYQITDISGARVSQTTIANQDGSLQIDFSAYTTGVYFLTINCKEPMTYKIIKE